MISKPIHFPPIALKKAERQYELCFLYEMNLKTIGQIPIGGF